MTGFLLSPAAERDVTDIWHYTVEHWGPAQAASYVSDIRDACRELVDGSRISRTVEIREGYRKIQVGSHVLYFRTSQSGTIIIVRILHQSMDVGLHI